MGSYPPLAGALAALLVLLAGCTREVVREVIVTSTPSVAPTATETATSTLTATPVAPTSVATQPVVSPTPDPTPSPEPVVVRFAEGDEVEVNTRERSTLALLAASSPDAAVLRNVYNGSRLRLGDGPKIREGVAWWGVSGGGWTTERNLQLPGEAEVPPRFAAGDRAEVNTRSVDRLIVREQATRESPEVTRLTNGTVVVIADGPVAGTEATWWGLEGGGWVAEEYIQPPGFAPYPESYVPTPEPTPVCVYEPAVAAALEDTVRLYYALVDDGYYADAYQLTTAAFKANRPFVPWRDGYGTTAWISVEYVSVTCTSPATVEVRVTAGDYTASGYLIRTFATTWSMRFEDGMYRLDYGNTRQLR